MKFKQLDSLDKQVLKETNLLKNRVTLQKNIVKRNIKNSVSNFNGFQNIKFTVSKRTFSILQNKGSVKVKRPIYSIKTIEQTALYEHGLSVFGDSLKFEKWLKKPNDALNEKIPFSLLNTSEGIKKVDDILGRIENGIFS